MTDPWQSILETLEPEYQSLKSIMDQGPYIKPVLYQSKNKRWRVTLEEVWPDLINSQYSMSTNLLDDRVEEVVEELEQWPEAKRTSWDTWDFTSKRAAEKFLIFYNLKWSQ